MLAILLHKIYFILWIILTPIIPFIFIYRIIKRKETFKRINERVGYSFLKKPKKELIWINAVSLGELRSTIPLIKILIKKNYTILITTVTLTSAAHVQTIIKDIDKDNIIHQFSPLDHPFSVYMFINHWKPSCVTFIESEIWPNLINYCDKKNIPLVLLQGRMTEKSYKKWLLLGDFASNLFNKLSMVISQDNINGERFKRLGATNIIKGINLKSFVPAPYMSKSKEIDIFNSLSNKNVLLFASLHNSIEFEAAITSHKETKKYINNLITIIVPRHPDTVKSILSISKKYSLNTVTRSQNQKIDINTDIYIADTIGELGTFFKVADVCFVGGSLSSKGGHNLIEPAKEKCAIIYGPDVRNHQEISNKLLENNASIQINNVEELHKEIINLYQNKENIKKLSNLAYNITNELDSSIEVIINELKPYLKK